MTGLEHANFPTAFLWLAFHFLGTLPARRLAHEIAKTAIRRSAWLMPDQYCSCDKPKFMLTPENFTFSEALSLRPLRRSFASGKKCLLKTVQDSHLPWTVVETE